MRWLSDLAGTLRTSLSVGRATISAASLTAPRTTTLPDKDGTLATLDDLTDGFVSIARISASLSSSTAISDVIPNTTSEPSSTDGYLLFTHAADTFVGQTVQVHVDIPYMQISATGSVILTAWADGVFLGMSISRVTTGATSGNGISLLCVFQAVGEISNISIRLGVSSSGSSITLYNRFGTSSQAYLTITKFGQIAGVPEPGIPGDVVVNPRGLKRLAVFGDSVTANNSSSSSRERLKDNGYLPWALRFCQQRYFFPQEWNFGVGGDNTADFLARIQTVIDAAPHIAVGTIGGNDVTQSIAVADTINNLTEILDRFEEAGIFVVLGKIYPRGPATTYTTAHRQKASTINNFLQAESLRRRGFELLDANPDFVDFTDTSGRGRAKCLPDGIHPGVYGASILGRRLGALLSALEPARPDNFTDAGNAYHATNNPNGNLLPNGCMFGSDGTVAIGTGQIATGSRIDATGSGLTVVCDVASQAVPGSYANSKNRTRIQISGTAGGAGHQIVFKQDAVAIPVGATVEGLATVRVSGLTNARALQLDIRAEHTGGILYAVDCEVGDFAGTSGEAGEIVAPASGEFFDWVLRTPRIVVPSGTTVLSLRIATGAGPSQTTAITVEIFDMTLRVVS